MYEGKKWMQNTCAEKWPIGHFSASLSKNRPKIVFLGQKFEFWGQIARKQEFSQIQANIPQIGNHKYYNLGEFEKILRARFFSNVTNVFSQKWPKFTKSAPEPNTSRNKIWKYQTLTCITLETCMNIHKDIIK